jgi:beta-galactosidase
VNLLDLLAQRSDERLGPCMEWIVGQFQVPGQCASLATERHGMNTFRHWFLWSAIEVAPGQYNWEEYDRQLDLAPATGIKTIIAEMITAAPEWAFRRFAHARYETAAGRPLESSMSGSCATGGFPGLCLDNDDYRAAAAEVESYGLTWVACRKGDEPWKQWHAVDLTRAASRGKRFWHAEAQGGPLWMQPQLPGRPREDGRIPDPDDLRYWHLLSFAGDATGLLYPRWRPLLDGPLFGAFGPYALDGSRTPRSAMTSTLARGANAPEQANLWRSRPVRGEVGIVYVPETQVMTYAQQGNTTYYAQLMQGAYRGFLANNIQADWVHVDDIAQYDLFYLPVPFMLSCETADRLRGWVAGGGTLVSEGCPAYFGEGGHVGAIQPNYGLDEVFGARESTVEFTPDLLGDLRVNMSGTPVWGGLFMQAYRPTTGTAVGWYEYGQVAVVDNHSRRSRVM